MIKNKAKTNAGFIALMSAIIISVVLFLVVVGMGFTSFYSRSDILDYELKEKSSAAAEACVDAALSGIKNNIPIDIGEPINLDDTNINTCVIKSILDIGPTIKAIKSDGIYDNKYFTHLEVKFNPSDMSIFSWEETPN